MKAGDRYNRRPEIDRLEKIDGLERNGEKRQRRRHIRQGKKSGGKRKIGINGKRERKKRKKEEKWKREKKGEMVERNVKGGK